MGIVDWGLEDTIDILQKLLWPVKAKETSMPEKNILNKDIDKNANTHKFGIAISLCVFSYSTEKYTARRKIQEDKKERSRQWGVVLLIS